MGPGTPVISASPCAEFRADRLDGGAALAEHDLALAFALDKDRLLDADRICPCARQLSVSTGGLVSSSLMQLPVDFFRVISAGHAASARPTSGPRIVKRPRRHHVR